MATIIVLNQAQMGCGEAELGRRILTTCLRKLPALKDLQAIVLYNSGVLLAARDSFVAHELLMLHEQGVDILACGTCVEHFGLGDRLLVDHPSSMDEILAAIRTADKVVTL